MVGRELVVGVGQVMRSVSELAPVEGGLPVVGLVAVFLGGVGGHLEVALDVDGQAVGAWTVVVGDDDQRPGTEVPTVAAPGRHLIPAATQRLDPVVAGVPDAGGQL